MIKLVLFFRKIYVLLLFIALEALALHLYSSSDNYTKARLLTLSNSVIAGGYKVLSGIEGYFTLGRENRVLTQQVAYLRTELASYVSDTLTVRLPEGDVIPYQFMAARVVSNNVTGQQNFMTLDKGTRNDVDADMAVLTPKGSIVGYVLNCSNKFSAAISILNTKFRTSGRFLKADYVGSVFWDGTNNTHLTLADIPRDATISKGDTIVTSDYSRIFPPGMMIGIVDSWKVNDRTYSYDVSVKLTERISSLREVVLVRYMDMNERAELETATGY